MTDKTMMDVTMEEEAEPWPTPAHSKADILQMMQAPVEVHHLEVPGYGAFFHRTMSGDERDEWEASCLGEMKKGKRGEMRMRGMRARLCAIVICDAHGNSFFSMADAPDVGKLPSKVLSAIFDESSLVNGLSEDDVEELVGN